jgi:signal transduction histidine kinase
MIENSSIEMFAGQICLRQIVSNFLTNVSKYSAEGTEVNISVEADNYEVVVEVTDQGIVIDVL